MKASEKICLCSVVLSAFATLSSGTRSNTDLSG